MGEFRDPAAGDDGQHDLDVYPGCPATSGGSRGPDVPAPAVVFAGVAGSLLGYAEYGNSWHNARRYSGGAGGVSGGAVHHRGIAVDQLSQLGAFACGDPWSGPSGRHYCDRSAVDRLYRKTALRGRSRKPIFAKSRPSLRPAQVLGYGIVPQILPAFWGVTVFRWEINIRESAILILGGAWAWAGQVALA